MKIITEEENLEGRNEEAFRFFSYSDEKPGCFGAGDTKEESEQSFLDGLKALEELEDDDG